MTEPDRKPPKMGVARRLLFVVMFLLMLGVPMFGYFFLLSKAQAALYGPVCERECEASSLKYEDLASGRGSSVIGCYCKGDNRTVKLKPRFYVDLPVVNGMVGLLVTILELCGLFAFVYAPFGLWRFIAARRSPPADEPDRSP